MDGSGDERITMARQRQNQMARAWITVLPAED